MIACVSPAYSSANHTINTLRYSDRLKEKPKNQLNSNNNLEQVKLGNNNINNAPSDLNKPLNYKNKGEMNIDKYMNNVREDNMMNFGDIEMDVYISYILLNSILSFYRLMTKKTITNSLYPRNSLRITNKTQSMMNGTI